MKSTDSRFNRGTIANTASDNAGLLSSDAKNDIKRAGMHPTILLMAQLLPLIVFVVADAFVSDVRISICCAIIFSAGQLAVAFVRFHRFEWIVLADAGLIVLFGGISIAFKNDLFFLIKPAVMEGLAIIFFFSLMIGPDRFLLRYLGRMLPGRTLNSTALRVMKTMMVVLCISILVHIGAVLMTAFYASKEIWAMVSGPGFYLTLLPGAVVIFILKKRR